ncbi:MAG: T9SS type A sorting domain-containing protein [Candidatus Azobacteroides sp.]|nr:T9SS type A sorting domain-containing protein [Candidatus Azobacteroides sp.]
MRRKSNTFIAICMVIACITATVNAYATTQEVEIDLTDISGITASGFHLSYNDGLITAFDLSGGAITTVYQQFSWTHNGCGLSMPNSGSFPVWKMEGIFNGMTGYEDGSTWIDITVTGDARLQAVELTGTGTTSSGNVFTAGFSTETDGTGYQDGEMATFLSGRCTGYSLVSPAGKEIKSIRLVSSNNFAGLQYNGASGGVTIKELKVIMSYISTAMEGVKATSLELSASEDVITASTACRIRLYSLSGILVKEGKDTKQLSISELAPGIYIVHGETADGKKEVMRFIK